MEEDPILTTKQAAEQLGTSVKTVQVWMDRGVIFSWKTAGGHRRTRKSHIVSLINSSPHHIAQKQVAVLSLVDPEYLPNPSGAFPQLDNEAQRLAAVAASNFANVAADEKLDRIVRIASLVTKSPIALISAVTATRQRVKASVGQRVQEVRREWSFCAYTIQSESLFIVGDTLSDPRFKEFPSVVIAPQIRFYAGVPLRDRNGMALGALCIMDYEPRKLRLSEMQDLLDLAALVTREIQYG